MNKLSHLKQFENTSVIQMASYTMKVTGTFCKDEK